MVKTLTLGTKVHAFGDDDSETYLKVTNTTGLHLLGTSTPLNTLAGMSWQCLGYHLLQTSHSAISLPTSSGMQQEQ